MMHVIVTYRSYSGSEQSPEAANLHFSAEDGTTVNMTVSVATLSTLKLGMPYAISIDEVVDNKQEVIDVSPNKESEHA